MLGGFLKTKELPPLAKYEKVVFSTGDFAGYGIKLKLLDDLPVVEAMCTPIPVYYPDGSLDSIQAGDVLFALNGELLRPLSAMHLKKLLTLQMPCTFSFMDATVFTQLQNANQLISIVKPSPKGFLSSVYSAMPSVSSYLSTSIAEREEAQRKHEKVIGAARSMASMLSYNKHECAADQAFALQRFRYASQLYTLSIGVSPKRFHLYAKRAVCFLRINRPEEALRDAGVCVTLRAEWPMGYLVKAWALWDLGRSMDCICALACALTLSPSNLSVQANTLQTLQKMQKYCIVLSSEEHINAVLCCVVSRGGSPSKIDRVAVARGSLERISRFEMYLVHGKEYVMLLQTGQSGLVDGDLISWVDGASVENIPFLNLCEEIGLKHKFDNIYDKCQVSGLINRWSASAPQTREASKSVYEYESQQPKLKKETKLRTLKVTNCGTWFVNGIYIPQEVHNECYVYENEFGCLLSLEVTDLQPQEKEEKKKLFGWVLGRNGNLFYAKNCEGDFKDAENTILQQHEKWTTYKGRHPTPSIERYHMLPPLEVFTLPERTPQSKYMGWLEWSAMCRLLALKGYALRHFNAGAKEKAVKYLNILLKQTETLLALEEETSSDTLYLRRIVLMCSILLGRAQLELRRPRQAKRTLETALLNEERCLLLIYYLGLALEKLNKRKEAIKIVNIGIQIIKAGSIQVGQSELLKLSARLERDKGRDMSPIVFRERKEKSTQAASTPTMKKLFPGRTRLTNSRNTN